MGNEVTVKGIAGQETLINYNNSLRFNQSLNHCMSAGRLHPGLASLANPTERFNTSFVKAMRALHSQRSNDVMHVQCISATRKIATLRNNTTQSFNDMLTYGLTNARLSPSHNNTN